jgi:hypothetical protein
MTKRTIFAQLQREFGKFRDPRSGAQHPVAILLESHNRLIETLKDVRTLGNYPAERHRVIDAALEDLDKETE